MQSIATRPQAFAARARPSARAARAARVVPMASVHGLAAKTLEGEDAPRSGRLRAGCALKQRSARRPRARAAPRSVRGQRRAGA